MADAIWSRDGFGRLGVGVSAVSRCATNTDSLAQEPSSFPGGGSFLSEQNLSLTVRS
jgi:hypothetical protein